MLCILFSSGKKRDGTRIYGRVLLLNGATPTRDQHTWMPRTIVNCLRQFISLILSDSLARRLLLRRTYFEEQIAVRLKMRRCLGDQAIKDGDAIRTAVQRYMRFVIAYTGRQLGNIVVRDVWRIAEDKIEAFARRNGGKQIALQKANALGDAMSGGIA